MTILIAGTPLYNELKRRRDALGDKYGVDMTQAEYDEMIGIHAILEAAEYAHDAAAAARSEATFADMVDDYEEMRWIGDLGGAEL